MTPKATPQLETYRKKRDPERTPEPFGGSPSPDGHLFVIQKHDARRLHYDLRLEMDGVLKSWAVPKGPSIHPHEKRLAVQVEDHPLEYADFEGVIPPDNYGAGPVIVWDRGWYRLIKPEDPLKQLGLGKLEVEFFGHKLRGQWTLVRMSKSEKDWLLLKKADAYAGEAEITERYPQSIFSGLTIEEARDASKKLSAIRARLKALGAPKRSVPARSQPFTLATLEERPFSGKEWLFEIKYDGIRVLAERRGREISLYGRNGTVITGRYPELLKPLRALPVEQFVIDGEIVALDEQGRSSFQRLQGRMGLTNPRDIERAMTAIPVVAIFFDCLELDGHDLRDLPLIDRKECLKLLLPPLGLLRYGDHVIEHGEAFYEAASEQQLEGIVAKRIKSRYTGKRTRDWTKIKCQRRQEFVIGGYTDPQGARSYFGALHIGVYEGEKLVYVSKVGTGFDGATLKQLWEKLKPLARATSPFDVRSPKGRVHHWVEPKLVCEVRFSEWTSDGGIRLPAFLGLREDKRPEDVQRETETPPLTLPSPHLNPPPPHRGRGDKVRGHNQGERVVNLTNLKKVFWPNEGYTKGDLVDYYTAVAPLLLPYLKDRPLVLTRYPDGIKGKSFFQKDAPEFAPDWLRTETIYSEDTQRDIHYIVVDDLEALTYVANSGAIPIHVWHSRVGSLDQPDWLVIDLDPKGAPFTDVVSVARSMRRILDELELPSYVKTSGATGLHILIPLGAQYNYDQAKSFARLLATLGVEAEPKISTIARPLRARGGKVYIDFGQNGQGQTIVAPFSVRPLPGAPVSCPLRWEEITARLDPSRFTIKTILKRFEKMPDPLAPVLTGSIDMAAAVARIEKQLRRH